MTIQTDQTLIHCLYMPPAENKFSLLNVDSHKIVAYPEFPYSQCELKYIPQINLIGSVDGIVCFDVSDDYLGSKNSIYLWNPATRQYKVIPSYNKIREEAFGFGYDEVDHDFKVVRVVMVKWPPFFGAEVYSADANVWQKLPDPIEFVRFFDVCVNGFLCGIGDFGMVAFDLNKEVLNCAIKLPVICDDDHDEPRLIEFNKSVVVIVLMDDKLNNDGKIKMWMLDDVACLGGLGIEALWTPMFITSIGRSEGITHGYFSNGDVLLMVLDILNRSVWISCNVDKKEAKIVPLSFEMNKHGFCSDFYKYTESLVTVTGFKQASQLECWRIC